MEESQNSTNASASSEDTLSPFFLHHSDHPGLVLISKTLTSKNYSTWSRSMRMALTAKNKVGFIDGTIQRQDDDSDLCYFPWERCNTMIFSCLLNSVSAEISRSIIYADSVHEVWEDLKDRFSQINASRIFEIQHDISNHHQEQQSVVLYFTKLKALWDELSAYRPTSKCSCGAIKSLNDYAQQDRIMKFLMGLNDSYAAVRGQILLMDPLPTINQVYSLVWQDERQRIVAAGNISQLPTSVAFMGKSGPNTYH